MEDLAIARLLVEYLISVTSGVQEAAVSKPVEIVSLVRGLTISLEEGHAAARQIGV